MHSSLVRRLATFAISALFLAGCGLLPKEVEEAPPPLQPPVKSAREIFTVTRGDIVERVALRAFVAPQNEALLFFRQGGRIKKRHVEAGQSVAAGQVIMELETGNLVTQIELARINKERAELKLKQAKEKAETAKGGLDPYEEQFLSLDVRAARLSLENLEAQLAEARITAPFAGLISDVKGNPGEQVNPFQTVATIQDPRTPVIKAEADEATLARLTVGLRAEVQFTELGERPVPAALVAVPSGADASGGAKRQVVLRTEAPLAGIKLGSIGRAHVVLQEKKGALILPNAAIRSYAGRRYVVVVDGDSRREVDIGVGIAGETETEITKGLTEGQKVMGR